MLKSRSPPMDEKPQGKCEDAGVAKEEEDVEPSIPDPRAALMAMLQKRAPLVEDEVVQGSPKDEEEVDELIKEKPVDPRSALMDVLKKRAPLEADDPQTTDAKEEANPRAALVAMLNKRAPANEDTTSKTDDMQGRDEKARANETEPSNPRAALMSMLHKRSANTVDANGTTESMLDVADKAEAVDPRASLMAMLNKRSPNNELQPEDNEPLPDPRSALMSMLKTRTPPSADDVIKDSPPVLKREKGGLETSNSRAGLMSMLKNRAPPVDVEKERPTKLDIAPHEANVAAKDEEQPVLRKDPRFEKYFRMMKMVSSTTVFICVASFPSLVFTSALLFA